MTRITITGLILACGSAALADVTPAMSPEGVRSGARVVGHFYVNLGTGEVIGSTEPAARPRGLGDLIWIADNDIPCADVNGTGPYTVSFVGIHDDPADVGQPDNDTAYLAIYRNWAEAQPDTVVDVVQVSTYADHPDVDSDGDGVADGVEGLAAEWSFYEADSGGTFTCGPVGLISIRLESIPGNLTPGEIEGYIYTVDLTGDFDTDLSFELGDSNGDPQSAAIHHPFIWPNDQYIDWNNNGLVDFSYNIRYLQPGTMLDADGTPLGDPANRARTYSALAAPRMDLLPDPPTTYTVLPPSIGSEDAFAIFVDPNGDDLYYHYGTFWYGGFSCDRDGDSVFEGDLNGSDGNADGVEDNDYRPYASFFMVMYGPGDAPPCPADLFPAPGGDSQLNFFDISYYLDRFTQADPAADFFPPGGDGVFNFFDIAAFLAAFNAGCP
jgi:hypothetical protein